MSDVTRILSQIESGDPSAAEQLLPLVYDELRKLAAARMAAESPDHTLQATALVHEAYLRLVDGEHRKQWDSRGHFFAAAAEAMRRILVDSARRRQSVKRGGGRLQESLDEAVLVAPEAPSELLALDEALSRLEANDPRAAELIKLRYFAGLTIPDVAEALGVSPRTADDIWAYARAWLFRELQGPASDST
jgi:RNA polymerase sigma factor (TIGR02999 family)